MHRRPDRKLATLATALAALPLLGGCVQATRHSNTMVFGTNTTVGVKIGTDAMQIPAVEIGYNRQEAVIMPLLANTAEREGARNKLSPCQPNIEAIEYMKDPAQGKPAVVTRFRPSASSNGSTSTFKADPCQFVGLRADNNGLYVQDSYSVLASFGAEISGNATKQEAAVGLAQYFATGVAAQLLAATGGAAVVSVGKAAEKSAESPGKAPAAAAVLGADNIPNNLAESFDANANDLKTKLRETNGNDNRSRKIAALYKKLKPTTPFAAATSSACLKGLDECLKAVDQDSSYLVSTGESFTEALKDWASY